jgi:hypothetical protein
LALGFLKGSGPALTFGLSFEVKIGADILYSIHRMSALSGGITEVKDYPLSDGDIRQILGDDIKILTYPDLGKLKDWRGMFDAKGRCILLFLTMSPTAGHWCCMLNKQKGIEFFDPYGEPPGEILDELPRQRLEALDQDSPYLANLLRQSGRPVFYNTHAFQKDKAGVNTCGRWCVARCLYAPNSLEYFKSVIDKSGMSGDDFVGALTADALGK